MLLHRTVARSSLLLGRECYHRSFASSSSPTVLLLDDIELAKEELGQLKEQAEVVRSQAKSREDFIKEVKGLSNVTALYRHFGGARSIKVCDLSEGKGTSC